MNIVSSTKLRANLSDVFKKIKSDNYMLIAQRGKIKWGIVEISYLKSLLTKVDNVKLKEIDKLINEFEEVYK